MGLYEVPLSMSLLGFGMGTMLASFHMCGIMLVLRVVLTCSWGMRVQKGLCVLGAWCLICQDLVSCYFYFVLLPLGPELWWVLCYILVFCALLCWCICLSCVLPVWQCLWNVWWNNSQCVWVWLLFCCWIGRKQCLDFMHLAAVIWPNIEWVSLVDCFCLSTLAHTSLLIAGGAIPDSKYKSSALVGFRYPVTDQHDWFSSGSRFLALADLAQTGAAYLAVE